MRDNITIGKGQIVDLFAVSGVPVGTNTIITLVADKSIRLYLQPTAPVIGVSGYIPMDQGGESKEISGKILGAWVYSDFGSVVNFSEDFTGGGNGAGVGIESIKAGIDIEITGDPSNPIVNFDDANFIQVTRDLAPVTTFLVASGISNTMIPGETIDVSTELFSFFNEQFVISTGAKPLAIDSSPFVSFLRDSGTGKTAFVFPDIEVTTGGMIDVSEVGVSCRISGTFSGDLDSVVLVEYYMLTDAGELGSLIGTMAFERQFQTDFTDRAQSLVSRLSKTTSTLVQNGAKFIVRLPTDAPGTFTLTEIDFLITVSS